MRILVVDDDYVSRVKLVALLGQYGQCDNAPCGEIAIKLFEQAQKSGVPYNLVTMDIEMPDMDGQAVVKQMRAQESALGLVSSKQAKILMVTAKTALKEVSTSYHEGCDGYLTKPTTPQGLKDALKEVNILQ